MTKLEAIKLAETLNATSMRWCHFYVEQERYGYVVKRERLCMVEIVAA